MPFFATLASIVGIEVEVLKTRFQRNAVASGLMAFFLVSAAIFLLVALHAFLVGLYGPLWAPLIIAVTAIVLTLIVYGVVFAHGAGERRRAETARRLSAERNALFGAAATTALPLLARSPLLLRAALPLGVAAAIAYLWIRDGREGGGAHPPAQN